METEIFSIQMNTENQLMPAGRGSHRTLELLVCAPKSQTQEERPCVNLALVLDRSGSMHGEKMEYARQAAAHVLDLLAESDRAAIIAFDDQVQMIAESTSITPTARTLLKHKLAAIQSGGSTNLSEGWLRGCEQVSHHIKDSGQVNRALLLTDGMANAGITDLETLAVHARELAGRGVSTSTFGVGDGYNEFLLESMAQQGRGSFYFISMPSDIPQIFNQEFEELSAITLRDVEIELSLPANVEVEVLGGLQYEKTEQKLRISIGSLFGGYQQGVYLNLILPPCSLNSDLAITVVVRAKSLDDQVVEAVDTIVFHSSDDDTFRAGPIQKEVLERAAKVRISDHAIEALKLERAGRADEGANRLETALQSDRTHLTPDLIHYHEDLTHRLRQGLREQDRKSAHYTNYLTRSQRSDPTFQMRQGGFSSSTLVEQMITNGQVRINDSSLLHTPPAPLPVDFDFGRIEGMLLGLAIGDSLGNTSESKTSTERRSRYGEITAYLPNRFAGNQPKGVPSDDTQMAFWTVETLIREGRLYPDTLARRFSKEKIFGIGSSVKDFLRNFKDHGMPWHLAGVESAGNGALMRIAPVLVPYLRTPSHSLWSDAVLAGMVTHNDYASNAACVAFTAMLWDLLSMKVNPEPEWWIEAYCQHASLLEGNTKYQARMPGVHYQGPVWKYAQDEVKRALRENWTIEQASNRWGSGAFLLETVPNVLFILARHSNDPEQAIIRAVNDTHDNDTIAAIVGAAVGAFYGKAAFPERWLDNLLGRTNDHNDGYIFHLIDEVRTKFWEDENSRF